MSAFDRTDSTSEKDAKLEGGVTLATGTTNGSGDLAADLERVPTHLSDRANDIDRGLDPELIKRVKRKVDWRLVPVLGALYAASLIDRTNLSMAYVAGMGKDLHLAIENRYGIATLMFFVPYILFEIPSNLGIRKFGAAAWLSGACLCWGIVMLGMGFVQSWGALTALRALVGLFESALFPGAAYLLGCWNVRKEVQTRMSMFYLFSVLISGFSAILSYGFSRMEGLGGLAGWRWIFIMCGLITIVVAGLGFIFIIDFPDSRRGQKFLTQAERELIKTRIERDRGDSEYDQLTLRKIGQYFVNPMYWAYGVMFCGTTMVSYAFAYFMPLLLRGMGFDTAQSQILVFPPYAASFVFGAIEGVLSDRFRLRGPFIIFNAIINIIACILIGHVKVVGVRYFGCFLACIGSNANVALIVGWMHSCITGQSKRAYGSALVVLMGGVGGIIASLAYKTTEAPLYHTGLNTTLSLQAVVVVIATSLMTYFSVQNNKALAGKINIQSVPGFRYML